MIRTRIGQLVKRLVTNKTINLPINLTYQHPSLYNLSKWVFSEVEPFPEPLRSNLNHDACAQIKSFIKKYSPPALALDEVQYASTHSTGHFLSA